MDIDNLIKLVLYAMALAMGVTTFVMSSMGQFLNTGIPIGIALFCLGLAGVSRVDTKKL